MAFSSRQRSVSPIAMAFLYLLAFLWLGLDLSSAHESQCASEAQVSYDHHHCDHEHHNHHNQNHHQQQRQNHDEDELVGSRLLPEELAEEEDMKLYGFGPYIDHDHDHDHAHELTGLGLWLHALGCSFLVSMASLICLIILPVIFVQGKPSKTVVDSLALFGAGAMLGDAFLHQLPHAFGGNHSHSHDNHVHHHDHPEHEHSHAHSLEDLSIGVSILAGIILFLLVEKAVRYVEDNSGKGNAWDHGHHHRHHKKTHKLKDDSSSDSDDDIQLQPLSNKDGKKIKTSYEGNPSVEIANDALKGDKAAQQESVPRKRNTSSASVDDKQEKDVANGPVTDLEDFLERELAQSPTNLVFGYLNLFSDGVHNFTDGMALGSAFLLHGSVGGWSRTLFLLAHELPQEVGDFGILVRSGFSVSKALFFNFLSALVALAGTTLALLIGQDPGQSSLTEGFTAGGFIYIAVAGVLAEMNSNGKTTLKSIVIQVSSLVVGMAVALCISLLE